MDRTSVIINVAPFDREALAAGLRQIGLRVLPPAD